MFTISLELDDADVCRPDDLNDFPDQVSIYCVIFESSVMAIRHFFTLHIVSTAKLRQNIDLDLTSATPSSAFHFCGICPSFHMPK